MLIIRWSPPNELEISARPSELRAVMNQVREVAIGRALRAEIVADPTVDSRPYAKSLERLVVVKADGAAKVSVVGSAVHIVGTQNGLELLASNFDFVDEVPSGHHNHFEYYAGNSWIDGSSVPLVVAAR